MRIDVQFRHMDRSEVLEAYVTEKVTAAVEGFVHAHDSHVMVWLVSNLNRTNRGTPEFCCEIEVRYPQKKDVFISKADQDIHLAINEATDKLSVMLDEAGKREISRRRQPLQNTQPNI